MNETTISRPNYWLMQVIWYALGVIEGLLALRFVLRLLGANPAATFTEFIYDITAPIVAPFINVFTATSVEDGVFEWSTILAMVIYALIAQALVSLLAMSWRSPDPETRVEKTTLRHEH